MKKIILAAGFILCVLPVMLLGMPLDADDGNADYSSEGVITIALDENRGLPGPTYYGLYVYEGTVDTDNPGDPIRTIEKIMITSEGHTGVRNIQTPESARTILANMSAGYYTLEIFDIQKKVASRWIYMTIPGIKILGDEFEVAENGTIEVKSEVYYEGPYTLEWSSEPEGIVTVDGSEKDVVVHGVAAGFATVKVRIVGTDYEDTCTVTVFKVPTDLDLRPTSVTLYYDDPSKDHVTLQATPVPSDARTNLVWSSDDESIATVQNGVVKAHSKGNTIITVTDTISGISKQCRVTVTNSPTPPGPVPPGPIDPTGIRIDPEEVTLEVNETDTLRAILIPAGSSGTLVWSSSDPSIVSVSAGHIVAHAVGTAIITVSVKGLSATCTVHVIDTPPGPGEVTVTLEADDMQVGEYQKVRVILDPPGSEVTPVSWSSSDDAIATVDGEGRIHAISAGEVTITVLMSDGQYASVTIRINEVPGPEPAPDHKGNWCTWFWIILLIIILIELVLAVIFRRKYNELEDEVNAD